MTSAIKVSKGSRGIKEILTACYPEWKGRKVSVRVATSYTMSDYWDGGSRCYIKAYSLTENKAVDPSLLAQNPYNTAAHSEVSIPCDVLLVEHHIFCGKDAGVTIYAHPDVMPKFLLSGLFSRQQRRNPLKGAVVACRGCGQPASEHGPQSGHLFVRPMSSTGRT
jgi:hypothetical protein